MITSERNNRKMVDKTGRRLAIVYRPISELKLDAANPKDHSRRQVRQIANSIAQFGFITPVVIDAYGNVVAGHGRILAASLLGWTEVATIRVDHLSEAQIRAFRIADNRLTENSTWNERLLGEQLPSEPVGSRSYRNGFTRMTLSAMCWAWMIGKCCGFLP